MGLFQSKWMHVDRDVRIEPVGLRGHLYVPHGAYGVVAFAHGSGSSRFSTRNQQVAQVMHEHSIGTLLFDLLTEEEAEARENVFNIQLLAERLQHATGWLAESPETRDLPIGLCGASTGAAAALAAAAAQPDRIRAVVARGGRPDLASTSLADVKAPTLFIVGGSDDIVIELNRTAFDQLVCEKSMHIIPGATHLFPEPGTLEQVSRLASRWFASHL